MAVNINVPSQVKTYANLAAFPASGSLKTIYIAEDTNKTYRWTGSVYVEISASAAMTWGQIGGTLSAQTDLQSALDAKVPTSRTLTINGVTQDLSADRTFTISTGITIGSTAIASGVVGRVLFEGAGNVVQESSQLSWDNTNNALLVTTGKTFSGYSSGGSASDALKLELSGNGAVLGIQNSNASGFSGLEYLSNTGAPRVFTGFNNSNGQEFRFNNFATGGYIDFLIGGTSGLRIANTRNLLINTTTDAGFRLDVNGTARVSGNLTLNNTSGTNRSTDIRTSNSIDNFPTTTFYPSSGTNVGQSFQVIPRGTGFSAGIKAQFAISGTDTIADGTNFEAMVVRATGSAFTFSSGKGGTGTIRPMLFSAGFLDGVTNPNQLWLYSTGNVGINTTTDAGFRLDVNGTARFTGAVTTPAFTMSSNYLGITSGGGGGIFGATLNQPLYIWNRQISTGSGIIIDDFNGVGAANINLNLINIGGGYGTSGTCVHNTLMISRAINMASGTQTVRGFYYNPTLTNTTGLTTHYAIHTAVGRIRFENLPTSSAGLSAGELWNDAGTLKIV